jgi:hypothetical protein
LPGCDLPYLEKNPAIRGAIIGAPACGPKRKRGKNARSRWTEPQSFESCQVSAIGMGLVGALRCVGRAIVAMQ